MNTNEISNGIYWVGGTEQDGGLHCNPYLIIDQDEAVLIDPGSVLDFDYVFKNVTELIALDKIKYVILHHQDPDFCSSVPLFENKGAVFTIVTHWRAAELIKYYGVKSPYYFVNEHDFILKLKSGRTLSFVPTPYLHFPGAITTYDDQTQVLFSSDLFGAFSFQWKLYAEDDYIDKMKTFHEHYMPSNDILRPVMELFLSMDIKVIAPQHGSIIKDKIGEHIKALRDLECGTFLTIIKESRTSTGSYKEAITRVMKRYAAIYSKDEVLELLQDVSLTLNSDSMEVVDYNYRGVELWDLIFNRVSEKKGLNWLTVIEPMVQGLCKEYLLTLPDVFRSTLVKVQSEATSLSLENAKLKEINEKLKNEIRETQDQLIRCQVTGLYNYTFFQTYLNNSIRRIYADDQQTNPCFILINVDRMVKIRYNYGEEEVDATLKIVAYLLEEISIEPSILSRLQGASFGYYIHNIKKSEAVIFAEKIRNTISTSRKFIEKITVSIGVVSLDEIRIEIQNGENATNAFYDTALLRVKQALKMGVNSVCSNYLIGKNEESEVKILVVDTDETNRELLKSYLENMKYRILTASDGKEAMIVCEKELPTLIVSEVMLPKMDVFQVRSQLLNNSLTKDIPLILVSSLKNEDSIQQAAALGIEHYLKKPYALSELTGIIKNKVKGGSYESFR